MSALFVGAKDASWTRKYAIIGWSCVSLRKTTQTFLLYVIACLFPVHVAWSLLAFCRFLSESVRPLLLVHGWPGSVLEFYKIIPLLTEQGFHVIAPSIPGFGFSDAPQKKGGLTFLKLKWGLFDCWGGEPWEGGERSRGGERDLEREWGGGDRIECHL